MNLLKYIKINKNQLLFYYLNHKYLLIRIKVLEYFQKIYKIKNIIENNGIICVSPLYTEINLVCDLSYNIPPTHINKPEDTNPCPNPNKILPSIPCITLLKDANKYTAA